MAVKNDRKLEEEVFTAFRAPGEHVKSGWFWKADCYRSEFETRDEPKWEQICTICGDWSWAWTSSYPEPCEEENVNGEDLYDFLEYRRKHGERIRYTKHKPKSPPAWLVGRRVPSKGRRAKRKK